MGQKSDFLKECMTFQEKLLLNPRDKTAKLAKSSETTVQRNSLSHHDPQESANFLKEQWHSATQDSSKGLHK
jgi:hypothetical protein